MDEVRIEKNNHLENEEFSFLGEVSRCTEDNDPWILDVRVNTEKGNQVIRFKIDTGTSVSVIPEIQNLSNLSRTNKTFRCPGNTKLEVLGYFVGKLSYKEKEIEEEIYVIKNQTTGLLSRNASVKLGMITLINEVKKESLYEGLGQLKTQYKIRLRKEAIPYSIYVPRPVPLRMQEEVKKELRMQDLGVIAESEGPSEWCSPMVVATKSNGKIRICSDLTKLNKSVQREVYPMATVENSLSQIRGKYFSKIDTNSGFWQIPLEKSSWEYTNFLTPWGRFHYRKLPFGLTSAPEIFSKEMNRILKDEENVIIHMDDVLIMGDTEGSHDKSVQNVLNKIRAAGMTLNKKKCCFKHKEVEFIGFKISEKCIGAGEQIKAIELFPVPENVKAIKSFLGLINQ